MSCIDEIAAWICAEGTAGAKAEWQAGRKGEAGITMGLFSRRQNNGPPPLSVGLYGKLPSAPDFLRLKAGGLEVRRLDGWLADALSALQRLVESWEAIYSSAPPVYFIQGGGAPSAIFGIFTPSADQTGRRYPLVVFAEVAEETLLAHYPVIPHLRLLTEIEVRVLRRLNLSQEDVFKAVSALPYPNDEAIQLAIKQHQRYLLSTTIDSAFSAMFGPIGRKKIAEVVQLFEEICASLTPGRSLPTFGVRCPLGSNPMGNAAFWLALMQHYLPLPSSPLVLWCQDVMLLSFNKFSSRALAALWRPGWKDDSLIDIGHARVSSKGTPTFSLDDPLSALLT